MGKRRGRRRDMMPTTFSPPDMMKYQAESMARTAMENHPKFKKIRDEITSEVMKATDRCLGKLKGKKGK